MGDHDDDSNTDERTWAVDDKHLHGAADDDSNTDDRTWAADDDDHHDRAAVDNHLHGAADDDLHAYCNITFPTNTTTIPPTTTTTTTPPVPDVSIRDAMAIEGNKGTRRR